MVAPTGYREALVQIEDLHAPMRGYITGETWNGFVMPVFDLEYVRSDEARESLATLIANSGGMEYSTDTNGLPLLIVTPATPDEVPTNEAVVTVIDGREYLDIGAGGWVWQEVTGDDA